MKTRSPLLPLLALALLAALVLPARAADRLTAEDARHLLTRTGFGAAPDQIAAYTGLSWNAAVERLLTGVRTEPHLDPPLWMDEPPPDFAAVRRLPEEERRDRQREYRRLQLRRGFELKAWWWREMVETDSPLTERLTLFWHNHFTSEFRKVRAPKLMYAQNALLRRHALGNFRELLYEIYRDPAMLIYLDGRTNQKNRPNENFARELMELFTLGEGHYTEHDIKQAARAFTGWLVRPLAGESHFVERRYDGGEKEFLGRKGRFDAESVIDIILEEPQVARYVVGRLWVEFVSPAPDPDEIERLARLFRERDYELRPVVRELLLSPHFRAEANRGVLIKSPADLLAGTVRTFAIPIGDGRPLVAYSRQLGQDLFDPPNVKGWPGGTDWIDSNTLIARRTIVERAMRGAEIAAQRKMEARAGAPLRAPELRVAAGDAMSGDAMMDGATDGATMTDGDAMEAPGRQGPPMGVMDLVAWLDALPADYHDEDLWRVLLPQPPVEVEVSEAVARNDARLREYVLKLLLDPAYQLK